MSFFDNFRRQLEPWEVLKAEITPVGINSLFKICNAAAPGPNVLIKNDQLIFFDQTADAVVHSDLSEHLGYGNYTFTLTMEDIKTLHESNANADYHIFYDTSSNTLFADNMSGLIELTSVSVSGPPYNVIIPDLSDAVEICSEATIDEPAKFKKRMKSKNVKLLVHKSELAQVYINNKQHCNFDSISGQECNSNTLDYCFDCQSFLAIAPDNRGKVDFQIKKKGADYWLISKVFLGLGMNIHLFEKLSKSQMTK